jgi:hypothetical protein
VFLKNAEVLRILYEARRAHPDWKAKNYNVHLYNLRLDMVSRNTIAEVLGMSPKKQVCATRYPLCIGDYSV